MTARAGPPPPSADVAYLRTAFLERVTHELRGPVGVTAGALDEIEGALGPGAGALHPYFVMARRGLQRVLRVAERLQRTAQLERGAIEWAKVPTDLRELAQESADMATRLESRRSVLLEVSCSEDPCLAVADAGWLRIAFEEVMGNAIRFARSLVTVHTTASADEVTVTVTDDGPGFGAPPARRFESPHDRRGVGLSLALVFDVLSAHGGRMVIEGRSDTASGARVVLVLPRLKRSDP